MTLTVQARGTEDLYTSRFLANGSVVVYKNSSQVARIEPQIFKQGWKISTVRPWGQDPRFDAIADLPDGQVGLASSVSISGSDIHVHYRLTPLKDVQVISARAAVYLTYKDWMEAPYQVGSHTGNMPNEIQKGFVIAQSNSGPVSLGPAHKGLIMWIQDAGLFTTLEDDRSWGPYLSFTLNHGEPITPWVWKAGLEKYFDFTFTLNRNLTSPPLQEPTASKGLTGYWQGLLDLGDFKSRLALFIRKDAHGALSVFSDDIDGGKLNEPIPKVTQKGRDIILEDRDPTLGRETTTLRLNRTENSLTGFFTIDGDNPFFVKDKKYPLSLIRGLIHSFPRVDESESVVTNYTYQLPQTLSDGWAVGDLNQSPLDPKIVKKGLDEILQQRFPNIQSLVLVQKGRLLLDEYFYGYGPGDAHQLQSVSKSVFSILFGIAQDQGLLNTGQKLYDFFPEYRTKPGWDPQKEKITLGTLLSMTSGFACDDWVPETDCHKEMWQKPDWLDFVLSQPMNHEPGEHFAYCNDCLEPPGAVLAKVSGLAVPDFARKNLYEPLGFQNTDWFKFGPNGITDIAGSISLRPRDMAKLGQLFLQKGKWNGKRVVSEKWVQESTKPQAPLPGDEGWFNGYGYLWWRQQMPFKGGKIQVIFAAGMGGQYIFMVPDLDLVCVETAGNYEDESLQLLGQDFFKAFILGAYK